MENRHRPITNSRRPASTPRKSARKRKILRVVREPPETRRYQHRNRHAARTSKKLSHAGRESTLASIKEDEQEKLLRIEIELHKTRPSARTKQSPRWHARFAAAVRDSRRRGGRSAASCFLGPTGVGKTESRPAAGGNFCSAARNPWCVFDMSEYMEKHSVSKLIGAARQDMWVTRKAGQLTERVFGARPYSVILLDRNRKGPPGRVQHPAPGV